MELDTGSPLTMITETMYNTLKLPALQPATASLATFTGHPITVLGTVPVDVSYKDTKHSLQLLVVGGKGPNLCGRDWLHKLKILPFKNSAVHSVQLGNTLTLRDVLNDYHQVFDPALGLFKGVKVSLIKKPNVQENFFKARSLPFAMRERVGAELDRLVKIGVITPVRFSRWATPIVPVLKADKSTVRICGDFKLTANTAIDTDQYPLPKANNIFANLSGGKQFTKLDLKDAYNQLELVEDSRGLTVINTHKGLFQYNRLPFGISSAPAIFQRQMEMLLQGIPGTAVSLDDIIITGNNEVEHLANLKEVLQRFHTAGLRLRKDKCKFMQNSLTFLGHVIDASGLHPTDEKIKAIKDAPEPKNVTELRSFLGLLTYYAKFLPDLSTMLAPLYQLLQKNMQWQWSASQAIAFKKAKDTLCSSSLLVHFDPSKEVILACDASPYGLGAVLSHEIDFREQPIAFASRTLTPSEKNYSHLEKEALALIFGVGRFRDYLLGRKFVLLTDHRPLVTLLSEKQHVPAMANARIQRWALMLAAYDYTVRYRKGELNANADACSRLPTPVQVPDPPVPVELVLQMERIDLGPVTTDQIRAATESDPVLIQVVQYTREGWPVSENWVKTNSGADLHPFFKRRLELSVEKHILLWGNRIVVPQSLHSNMLQELHSTHQGMTSMKSIARSLFWWPNLDSDIEDVVRHCQICAQNQHMPAKVVQPWPVSDRPWERIHIDFAGPIDNYMILIIQDSYTKWIEAYPMRNATSTATVGRLYDLFARFGLPTCVVSDNGTAFTSEEFRNFMKRNGIRHLFTAPYHPSSNGQAERAVQYVKRQLKKVQDGLLHVRLARILMNYRRTPLAVQGVSPAELLLGRQIRSRLDLVHSPCPRDTAVKSRVFGIGDQIYARNFGKGNKWIPGVVQSLLGNSMYRVSLQGVGVTHRHVDQLRHQEEGVNGNRPCSTLSSSAIDTELPSPTLKTPVAATSGNQVVDSPVQEVTPTIATPQKTHPPVAQTPHPPVAQKTQPPSSEKLPASAGAGGQNWLPLRRSERTIHPPKRLDL